MTARAGVTTAMAGKKQRTKKAKSDRAAACCLHSRLDIHVPGAESKRKERLGCFRPIHQSYFRRDDVNQPSWPIASTLHASTPGGALRTVPSAALNGGAAVVYDRDIVTASS